MRERGYTDGASRPSRQTGGGGQPSTRAGLPQTDYPGKTVRPTHRIDQEPALFGLGKDPHQVPHADIGLAPKHVDQVGRLHDIQQSVHPRHPVFVRESVDEPPPSSSAWTLVVMWWTSGRFGFDLDIQAGPFGRWSRTVPMPVRVRVWVRVWVIWRRGVRVESGRYLTSWGGVGGAG